MLAQGELAKFNKRFEALFEIYSRQPFQPRPVQAGSAQPKLNAVIRSFAAALVAHSCSKDKIIKFSDISAVELLLRRLYFSCPKSARKEFQQAVVAAKDGTTISVDKVLAHLIDHIPPGERLNILTSVYELIDEDGVRSSSEALLATSLGTAV